MFLLSTFYSERSFESAKTHSSIQLFIFFHPRLLSGIALHNWLSRNILQVEKKKKPAHAAIFSQFPNKTDASFDIYDWKETKKTQQVSLEGAKNVWGCRVRGQKGGICALCDITHGYWVKLQFFSKLS